MVALSTPKEGVTFEHFTTTGGVVSSCRELCGLARGPALYYCKLTCSIDWVCYRGDEARRLGEIASSLLTLRKEIPESEPRVADTITKAAIKVFGDGSGTCYETPEDRLVVADFALKFAGDELNRFARSAKTGEPVKLCCAIEVRNFLFHFEILESEMLSGITN